MAYRGDSNSHSLLSAKWFFEFVEWESLRQYQALLRDLTFSPMAANGREGLGLVWFNAGHGRS